MYKITSYSASLLLLMVLVANSSFINYKEVHFTSGNKGNGIFEKPFTEDGIRIGQITLEFFDSSRNRPVITEVWFPTKDTLKKSDQYFSPFIREYTVREAKIIRGKFPLIFISHGSGGNRYSLEWLAQSLVKKGYIVAAVDHWGNTFDNKIAIEFVKPWERPLDMTLALTEILRDTRFKEAIDEKRIGTLGFSYGGYTVLALAGAKLDYDVLLDFFHTPEGKKDLDAISEFPGLLNIIEGPEFATMARQVPVLKDARFKAFFAISPGTAPGFIRKEQFDDIDAPVFIVGCSGDSVTPVERYARHYHRLIEGSLYYEFPNRTGHYVMLSEANEALQNEAPIPFSDHPTVDRKKVHQKVAELVVSFFGENLNP